MIYTKEIITNYINNCDDRINSIKNKIDNLKLNIQVKSMIGLTTPYIKELEKDIDNYNNNIKIINVEKLIYKAFDKKSSIIFPKLLSKYNELLNQSIENLKDMVSYNTDKESYYLEYCKEMVEQREYIKKLCLYGEKSL